MFYKTHPNQFGFKKKTSCNHALFVVKETILNYIEKGSSCRIAALDAEKAYDQLWRTGLMYKLINKIDKSIWFMFKKYYDQSMSCIIMNSKLTSPFDVRTGLKQGGILSSFLFNFYINNLIEECIALNIGALIDSSNTSIIGYADDLTLISPNDEQLQILLDKCTEYGLKWRIKFNPNKSHIISFGKQNWPDRIFYLNNKKVNETESIRYLGVDINNRLDYDSDMCEKFKKVQKLVFSLSFLGLKPLDLNPNLQAFIYKTYCFSTFVYGLETTTINKKTRDYINVLQNNLIRQMIGLNKFCHISKIRKAINIYNFESIYLLSKLSFINTVFNNEICVNILLYLIEDMNVNKSTKSFKNYLILLKNEFKTEPCQIIMRPLKYKEKLIDKLNSTTEDGILDSIKYCL